MGLLMFDIIFLSYNETDADKNWDNLKENMPFLFVKRIDGIDGILNGHKAAAELSNTRYFYVVDGDNWVFPEFRFYFNVSGTVDIIRTYVWRSQNPLNGLTYGYGGIKLFEKETLLNKDKMEMDMTLSIGEFTVKDEVASETRFNTSPFETWKSAFRECVKLSQQEDGESQERLNIWTTKAKGRFAPECIMGARDGHKFGTNKKDLNLINDFKWLKERFDERIK